MWGRRSLSVQSVRRRLSIAGASPWFQQSSTNHLLAYRPPSQRCLAEPPPPCPVPRPRGGRLSLPRGLLRIPDGSESHHRSRNRSPRLWEGAVDRDVERGLPETGDGSTVAPHSATSGYARIRGVPALRQMQPYQLRAPAVQWRGPHRYPCRVA